MRNSGSHRPSGSLADVIGGATRSFTKPCATCGQMIGKVRQTYCRPCSSERDDQRDADYRKRVRARKEASSS